MTAVSSIGSLSAAQLTEMYRKMWLIRHFDQRALELYREGLIRGTTHPYVGMEAVAVGACAALRPDDYITSTHRGHGHCIAKGGDVRLMMAELLGKATGYCRGKGGSMHIADVEAGILGANGIVGGGIGIATGAALSARMRSSGQVCLCFFGDGAINQGALHENANLAAIWKLPVVYICENNQYAMSMSASEATALEDLSLRATAWGFPGLSVDGMDVFAVYEAVLRAKAYIEEYGKPYFIEAITYRFEGHSMADKGDYRSPREIEMFKKRDPIKLLVERSLKEGWLTEEQIRIIDQKVEAIVEESVRFALSSPEPSEEELYTDIYCGVCSDVIP